MNKSKLILFLVIAAGFAASWAGRHYLPGTASAGVQQAKAPQGKTYTRVVSMAPSITEIIYAVGAEDRLVGCTKYCVYPLAAKEKPRIGGYYNPNYEAIVALTPDVVFLLAEHEQEQKQFTKLGLPFVQLDNRSLKGILSSIARVATLTDQEEKGKQTLADLKGRVAAVSQKVAGMPKPRVMVSLGRKMGTGSLKDAYVAGVGTIYDGLIDLAGGANVFTKKGMPYPVVTGEGILRMNPEVIIDMVAGVEEEGFQVNKVLEEWGALTHVSAVKSKRIHVFSADYSTVPGPRTVDLLEDMAKVIHSEAFAKP